MTDAFIAAFIEVASRPDDDLATPALQIARLEYKALVFEPYLERLDRMGETAARQLGPARSGSLLARVTAVNRYLFDEQGFIGNREQYDDPRNSFLNEVLDRRTGIPITLALIYLEVARRAGLTAEGINFPGHFLLRCPHGRAGLEPDIILDPFHGGAMLSESDCRRLYEQHRGETSGFDETLLASATKPQIIVRMLVNLKRLYVRMRSFGHAHDVTELLLAFDPSAVTELRDRGLLAYHLGRSNDALRDLETYLQLTAGVPQHEQASPEESRSEQERIWEHIKALRRRVASFN